LCIDVAKFTHAIVDQQFWQFSIRLNIMVGRKINDVHEAGNYRPTESMIACHRSF
jgi:hypothetical protein